MLLTLASLFSANPYSYGIDNHFITLPFVWAKTHPGSFPGDLVIAEEQYFYTWFLDGLAWLFRYSGLSLEALFFVLHTVFTFLTFAAFYHLGRVITKRHLVPAIACIFLLFGTKTIGYVGTLESQLMERTAVLPLELLALAWAFQRRWVPAFAATGIAFCLHPLSAFYTGAMIGMTGLYAIYTTSKKERLREIRRFAPGLVAGLVGSLPGLYLKFHAPEPVMPMGTPMPGWLDILALRSSFHVFPFTWPWHGWVRAAGFWIAVWLLNRNRKVSAEQRLVFAAWAAVGVMAILGTLFSEILPLSLPIQFQFFRSYPLAFMLGMIFLAFGVVRAYEDKHHVFVVVVALLLAAPAWGEMNPMKFGLMLCTWLALIFAGWYGVRYRNWPLVSLLYAPLTLVLLAIPLSVYLSGFTLHSKQEPAWVAVQEWAASVTPEDAGFIVPPDQRGFRVDSHRSVYVDWNDGTQNFFNQAFGPAWLERMKHVGFNGKIAEMGSGYRHLGEKDFLLVADEMPLSGQVYAVLAADMESPFPPVFENGVYRVVRVR